MMEIRDIDISEASWVTATMSPDLVDHIKQYNDWASWINVRVTAITQNRDELTASEPVAALNELLNMIEFLAENDAQKFAYPCEADGKLPGWAYELDQVKMATRTARSDVDEL